MVAQLWLDLMLRHNVLSVYAEFQIGIEGCSEMDTVVEHMRKCVVVERLT